MLDREVLGDLTSKYPRLVLKSQSKGDRVLRALNGDLIDEIGVALRGESEPEKAGDGGMRSFPSLPVAGAEDGKTKADVGGAADVGDL